jgi:hypothetical protein
VRIRHITRRLSVLGLVAGLWPAAVSAQSVQTGQAVPRSSTTLDVGLDVGGVYDDDSGDDFRGPQGGLVTGGYSSTLLGTASYARNRRRFSLSATTISALRYYSDADRVRPTSHVGGGTAILSLTRQASLSVTQTAAYSPSYLYQLFPSVSPLDPNVPVAAAPDYRVEPSSSISRSTRVGTTFPTPVGAVSLSGTRADTDFWGQTTSLDMSTRVGNAAMSWRFSRRAGLSAGYEYRVGQYGAGGESIDQRLRISADYTQPLSSTRRATFSVSVAPSRYTPATSTVTAPSTPVTTATPAPTTTGPASRDRLETSADVRVGITRKWSVNAGYRRGVDYVASLSEPLFNRGATLAINGSITRFLQVGASGGWMNGSSAASTGSQANGDLESYTGSVRLGLALGRRVSAYGEYLYYHYDIGTQAGFAPGLPTGLDRRTIRFGVSLIARPFGLRR